MSSHINMLEMKNLKLKEENKKVTKHFQQKKTDDAVRKVYVCIDSYNYIFLVVS